MDATLAGTLASFLDILLAVIDEPVLILDGYGILKVANQAGLGLCAAGFAAGAHLGKRMVVDDRAAAGVIERVAAGTQGASSGEIAICGPQGQPMRLSVVAIPDVFAKTEAPEPSGPDRPVLIAVRSERSGRDHKALAAAFGLTPAETRVLEKCLAGQAVTEIAESLHCSPHTVRNHLRAIYAKTGVHRFAELLLVATGAGPPPGLSGE